MKYGVYFYQMKKKYFPFGIDWSEILTGQFWFIISITYLPIIFSVLHFNFGSQVWRCYLGILFISYSLWMIDELERFGFMGNFYLILIIIGIFQFFSGFGYFFLILI